MAKKWKTIRIFISSTFRDMHAERDHLVRFVFPELREKCRKNHVHLIDVDLRWGVSEEDTQDGKALDICLDEIDSCRPYFLGLLGHRYGWIPPGQKQSITAQEIYHGVLHNDVPRQVVDLRQIMDGRFEGKTLSNDQIDCLSRCYEWDAEKHKYLLKDDVSRDELEIIRSLFAQYSSYQRNRSFFFFRSERLTKEMAGEDIEDYFEKDETTQEKLAALKQEIIDSAIPFFEYNNIEGFGVKVGEILWERIKAELELPEEEETKDWLEEEAELHELFMDDRTRRFVGRQYYLDRMHCFCEEPNESNLMVITGESGCGKSALMARFTEEAINNHPDWLIIPHFVGSSPNSANLRQSLRRFCSVLNQAVDSPEEVPEDIKDLVRIFPDLLVKSSKRHNTLFIIDAVNQLEKTDNAHDMRWLPQKIAENVKFVISTLPGNPFDALMSRWIKPKVGTVSGLNEVDIKELVADYLVEIRRNFPNKEIEKNFFNKVKTGNPLYIQVALEELRVFGEFESLVHRVKELPNNVPDLFDQVLERIEADFNPDLVRDCMSYIACGRHGMTAEELQALLKNPARRAESKTPSEKLPDMLWARIYRAFRAYLFERSGVIDFFHGQLKEAVERRYFQDENDRKVTHKAIADYFESRWREPYSRALDELPYQLVKHQDWRHLEQILTDLYFIEAKCAAGMTYELIADFNTVLNILPKVQMEREKELINEERVKKYSEDLIAYAKGDIDTLEIIPSVELWSDKRIKEDTKRIIKSPTHLDRIRAFSQFLNSERHALDKFASYTGFCIQQAYNSCDSGPVVYTAENIINSGLDNPIFLHQTFCRSRYNPHPILLKTFEGHSDDISSIDITPDGKKVISGGRDKTVRIWNLESGECLYTLEGHIEWITSVCITPDGKKAVSGSDDKTSRVWDLEKGLCIKTLKTNSGEVETVSITADGKRAIDHYLHMWDLEKGLCINNWKEATEWFDPLSITPDGKRAIGEAKDETLRVWDLEKGICIKTLKGHKDDVLCVSITPDGKRAISGSMDETLRVWDLEKGTCIKILKGHKDSVTCVDITPDGKRAISGSLDGILMVWCLEIGRYLKMMEGQRGWVDSVVMTPDGKRAVSGGHDGTLRVWDLERGSYLKTPKADKYSVYCVDITPDGKRAISGGADETLRLWNLASGRCLRTLKGHIGHVYSVKKTPDEKRVVSGSEDGTLGVWELTLGRCIKILGDHTKEVESLAITPDGKKAVSGSIDKTLRVWDLVSGRCLRTLEGHMGFVFSVNVTPDGKRIISGGDGTELCIWDLGSGLCSDTLDVNLDYVWDFSVTPDGKVAVIAGGDSGTIVIFDLVKGRCFNTLRAHSDYVKSVSITPDGKKAISGSQDGSLRMWHLENGQCICNYRAGAVSIESISRIKANGHFVCGTSRGELIFLRTSNISMSPPIVTPVRLWHHKQIWMNKDKGQWDDKIRIVCAWCGCRFPVGDKILDLIYSITRNAGLTAEQSPCLELPFEVWDEQKLLTECPLCNNPLKFNPFIVDNRER